MTIPAAFLSYAHEDNRTSRGRLLELAEAIKDEYSLITGEPLQMFVDRTGIEWGDAWRDRIADALDLSTVFVPIITPTYFSRQECRRELLDFYGPAEGLGVSKLIMPILFTSMPTLTEDNTDELVSLIARIKFMDWSDLRLCSPESEERARAVNAMALRISGVLRSVASEEIVRERSDDPGDGAEAGLAETLAGLAELLPQWLDAVQEDEMLEELYHTAGDSYNERALKVRGVSQEITLDHQFARSQEPLAQRALELAKTYYSKTVELHPHVTSVIRNVRQRPEYGELLGDLRAAVAEAVSQIEIGEIRWLDPENVAVEVFWARRAHRGRLMAQLLETIKESQKYRGEANEVVQGWAADLAQLPGG